MSPAPSQFRNFWIWYLGSGAWMLDGAIALHYGSRVHAAVALCVALLFLIAGAVWRSRSNRLR